MTEIEYGREREKEKEKIEKTIITISTSEFSSLFSPFLRFFSLNRDMSVGVSVCPDVHFHLKKASKGAPEAHNF